jgi:hypothetical protein
MALYAVQLDKSNTGPASDCVHPGSALSNTLLLEPEQRVLAIGCGRTSMAVEHVGLSIYDGFFKMIARLFTVSGVAVMHLSAASRGGRTQKRALCRLCELCLAASKSSFRAQGQMNFPIQLTKRADVVPLTRDYLTDHDREAAEVRQASACPRESGLPLAGYHATI